MLDNIEKLAINYITYATSKDYGYHGISPVFIDPSNVDTPYIAALSDNRLISKIDWCINLDLKTAPYVHRDENRRWMLNKFVSDPNNYEDIYYNYCQSDNMKMLLLSKMDYNYPKQCYMPLFAMSCNHKQEVLTAVSQLAYHMKLYKIITRVELSMYEMKYTKMYDYEKYVEDRTKPFQYNPGKVC